MQAMCRICWGEGYISSKNDKKKKKICPNCRGEGYVFLNEIDDPRYYEVLDDADLDEGDIWHLYF